MKDKDPVVLQLNTSRSNEKQHRLTNQDVLVFLALLLLTVGGGGLVGIVTAGSISEWYPGLVKPPWNPPPWLFGPVWTTLYFLQAVAAYLIWRRVAFRQALPWVLFFTQLALNFAWAPLFFLFHQLFAAFVESSVQALLILFTTTVFLSIRTTAGLLLLPYLTWVTAATYLSFTIWRLNPSNGTSWCDVVGREVVCPDLF